MKLHEKLIDQRLTFSRKIGTVAASSTARAIAFIFLCICLGFSLLKLSGHTNQVDLQFEDFTNKSSESGRFLKT